MLMMDHYWLTQIFLSLIENSVKYSNTGKVEVTVEWVSGGTCVSDHSKKVCIKEQRNILQQPTI